MAGAAGPHRAPFCWLLEGQGVILPVDVYSPPPLLRSPRVQESPTLCNVEQEHLQRERGAVNPRPPISPAILEGTAVPQQFRLAQTTPMGVSLSAPQAPLAMWPLSTTTCL